MTKRHEGWPWHEWLNDVGRPRYRLQKLFSEGLGAFLLTFVAIGGKVVDTASHGEIGRVAVVVAPGLMVMAIVLFMGKVSGAHLNPAVTLGFAARGDFPWSRVPEYIVAQLVGAFTACLFLYSLFGIDMLLVNASEPGKGFSEIQAFAMEAVLTFGLVSVILGTASKAQNVGSLSALAVGGYIVLAGLWSSPVSGSYMNPAITFGLDAVLSDFSHYWIYLFGPIIGSMTAVVAAYLLRGPGGDIVARETAQGEMGEDVKQR